MGNILGDLGQSLGIDRIPGVGQLFNPQGPALNSSDVVKDPATGLYVNKRTGVVSVDPAGTQTLINPSLQQQAARNVAVSNQLLGKLGGYDQQFQGAIQGQQGLVGELDGVISGQGPSVAGASLQQHTGDIARQQQSQAAGVTGVNAATARQQAMQNTAYAQAKASQDGALLRAGEVAQAREQKGNVLAGIAGQAGGMYGQNLSGGLQASGQAGSQQAAERGVSSEEEARRNKLGTNVLQGIGQSVGIGGK